MRFGNGSNTIIFVGGLHSGYAPSTVHTAQRTASYLIEHPEIVPDSATVYVVLNANPDSEHDPGFIPGRLNANDVDLNRNWDCEWEPHPEFDGETMRNGGGSRAMSEPEIRLLADLFLQEEPVAVVVWMARAYYGLVIPGGCGPPTRASYEMSLTYAHAANYRWDTYEDFAQADVVPGDITNWLDAEGYPAIAVLLPSFTNAGWESNRRGVEAILRTYGR